MQTSPAPDRPAVPSFLTLTLAFAAAAAVGVLGGMIGLGGAEFRLPLLIMLFGFAALQAVILNKALSLVVVLTALPAPAVLALVSVPPSGGVAVSVAVDSRSAATQADPHRGSRRGPVPTHVGRRAGEPNADVQR
ncbi:hypothetical protein [Micromonospora sp. NPDC005173]|uniref:hypothetical protein n=1 Tax=Micromonospora sp. NPDC005173 TaxID=3157165 RepID=UPI0033B7C177